jgi:Spy/CpxP family protein refolding chaperone
MWNRTMVARKVRLFMLLGLVPLAAGLLSAPVSSAEDGHHSRHKRDFVGYALGSLLHQKQDVNLSDEQVQKLKSLKLDYARTRIRGKAEIKLAEVDVRALMFDEKADLGAIESAMRKAESARTALRLEGVKTMRAAADVLSPEQREKWRAHMRARHGHDGHRGEYRRERA